MTDENLCLCIRVDEKDDKYVIKNSMMQQCAWCKHPIWVSESTLELAKDHPYPRVCMECFIAKNYGFRVIPLKDIQLKEIAEHRGED